MGAVSLSGTLLAGPGGVVSQNSFPSATAQMFLALRSEPAPYTAATGVLQLPLDSELAFVQLGGIDETIGPVKKATLISLRSPSEIALRITTDDGLGGEVLIETPHIGLFLKEWPDSHPVLKLEAKGVGLIEYFASGPG